MKFKRAILVLCLSAGCGLFSPGGGTGLSVDLAHNSATISGRIPQAPARDFSTYTISIFTVKSDGTADSTLGTGSVDTGGHYSVTVKWEGLDQLLNGIIVQVSDGQNEMRAVLAEPVGNKATSTAPPVDNETTTESDVYIEAKKSGTWSEHSTIAGLRAAIDADFATSLSASTSRAVDLHATALAALARMDARSKALASSSVGATTAQIAALESAEAKAQSVLDAALDAANSQAKIDEAVSAHQVALVSAHDTQGLSATDISNATRIALDASLHVGASFSTGLTSAWKASSQLTLATAVTRANEDAFASLNATSATSASVIAARTTLLAALKTSADPDAAWAAYNATVKTSLQNANDHLILAGGLAIDTTLGALTLAKTTLTTALSVAGTVDAVVAAYTAYIAAVKLVVSANLTLKLLGVTQLDATTRVVTELSF